uniref:Uncharacterized protein n=1 Tax=Thermocrinis ruber TaxID=75906 RepID=A0A7C5X3U6_9AQUI
MKRVWVAFARPFDDADHPEPWFRVVAPADWERERVENTLRDMGYDKVAYVVEICHALRIGLAEACFRGVLAGESLQPAWDYVWGGAPRKVLYLPSGRSKILPAISPRGGRAVINLPAFPQAVVSVHHEVDEDWHVIKVCVSGIPNGFFLKRSPEGYRYSEIVGRVLEDFSPIRLRVGSTEDGLEIEVPAYLVGLEQVQALCKLVKGLTEKLLRRGFLTYRKDGKGKALPEYYLEFLTSWEFQTLQPLKG